MLRDQATVIIPCFNVEEYIQECLDSVLLQGKAVHHTYVVDNNSTDSTVSKVKEWHQAHPTFPLTITEEKKPGAPAARNNPLSQIETKWIQFLDADDLLIEGKISDQIQKFPQADVICAASKHIATDGTERKTIPEPNVPLALMKGQAGNTCSNLFSTASILAVHGWDESLNSSQEYDLMFRLWKSGASFVIDPNPRTIIRERPSGQISQRDPRDRWQQLIRTQLKMLRFYDEKHVLDESSLIQCQQAIFDRIRILSKYDRDQAIDLFDKFLKPYQFHPQPNESNSKAYIALVRLVGFALAERIKGLTSKLK